MAETLSVPASMSPVNRLRWRCFIDVGGTFTDCVALTPSGELRTAKVLSSGKVKGSARVVPNSNHGDWSSLDVIGLLPGPDNFWSGCRFRQLNPQGEVLCERRVVAFHAASQRLRLDAPLSSNTAVDSTTDPATVAMPGKPIEPPSLSQTERVDSISFELDPNLDSPVLAMRLILGLPPGEPLPIMDVRLGTTRGTNALLERKGARTALIITHGFRDLLTIGNQDRPRLFDLNIIKPQPLAERVVEARERLAANGSVLEPLDVESIRFELLALRQAGIESLAICLMHSFVNPVHEAQVEALAREVGFEEISLSSRVAPRIKIVSRCDTSVLDAYLTPVLRCYLERIRDELSNIQCGKGSPAIGPAIAPIAAMTSVGERSTLKLMTSSGGIVDAAQFTGKDSILSGPAGGVIGFSRVAERAGFPSSIGFDMGGTSTDVSRYDGSYDLDYESRKAGVRIVTPMLAIETVAAGGGSICQFDGVQLRVGPESAGADPGPACYGRGGPLTVTDLNVLLGRLPVDEFPFPLQQHAAIARLDALRRQISLSPLGRDYSREELASGLLAIADAHMVRAIRRVSVEKGYDPGDDVLVTFGGAGGLHACAIARELGITTVLSHPLAGILSAYGIGLADVRRHGERPVMQRWHARLLDELESQFVELESELTALVESEGVAKSQLAVPVRGLDMRYLGTDSVLTVTITAPDGTGQQTDCAADYAAAHQRLFGYRRDDREIEVVAIRVEVVGRNPPLPAGASSGWGDTSPSQGEATLIDRRDDATTTDRTGSPPRRTVRVYCEGAWQMIPLWRRGELEPTTRIDGPALVMESTSTLLIAAGFQARMGDAGEIILQQETARIDRHQNQQRHATKQNTAQLPMDTEPITVELQAASLEVDPVTLEIFNHQFAAIAEQMGLTLQRTAISTNVKERLDFSCAIFDEVGNLIVNAPHIPVHLGAMGETVRGILADNPIMQPGDVFVTNDPYRGGSHLPDITVVSPVHDTTTGVLLFLTASRAHHAEIGGSVPGSMPPFSTTLSEEGVLIRNFRLVHRGESKEEELRELLLSGPYPTRDVDANLADLRAQVAANGLGISELHRLIARTSWETVRHCMASIRTAAAAKMRQALKQFPNGTRSFVDHLDDGSPIVVEITIAGGSACVDFTGTGAVLNSNLNANRAIVTAAVMYVFRCLIDEDIPLNSGVLEPIEIVLPESLLNPPGNPDPAQCAAMVGGNVETSQRVVDVLLGALGVAAASQGTMNNLTFGNGRFGYYETICGGSGATAVAAGTSAVHTHMTNTRLTDPEVMEHRYPVRMREFTVRRHSGGTGRHPGGDGVVRRLEFLAPLEVAMLSQRRGPYAPFGLQGGGSGAIGQNSFLPAGETVPQTLAGSFQRSVSPGDQLIIETPGAGGYGSVDSDERNLATASKPPIHRSFDDKLSPDIRGNPV